MTASDHTPADQPVARRAGAGDPATAPRAVGKGARPGLLSQMTENPLLSLFGAIIVVLLGFVLTTSNIRISETNDRITSLDNRINGRIDRLDSRINSRIDGLDSRIDRLDSRINSRIDGLEDRIDRLDSRINSRIDGLGDRIDGLDSRIGSLESTVASIDRNLTALIATLGKTDEVEGALSADAGGISTTRPLDEAEDR